jgi:hypothetical protein
MYLARPAGTTHSCLRAKLFLRADLACDVSNLACECSHVAHCNGLPRLPSHKTEVDTLYIGVLCM